MIDREPDFSIGISGGRLDKSNTHPHYVYLIRDGLGVVLYVGLTDRPVGRMINHRKERLWWDQAAQIDYYTYPNRYAAAKAEWQAIRHYRPMGNVLGNGGSANAA